MGMAVAVVLAAGLGTRVGADGNKAYLPLAGRSMLAWSLLTPAEHPDIDRTILVFRRGERDLAAATLRRELPHAVVELVEGGDTRHASEFNVLGHLAPDIEAGTVDVIAIHDAARPLAGPEMYRNAVALAREHGGALPALPLRHVAGVADATLVAGVAPATLRPTVGQGELMRVQTPQAFRAPELWRAYRCAERDGFTGTDTSSCVEHYTDLEVRTFPGSATNLKVTYLRDVAVADLLLNARVGSGPTAAPR
ncbi:IspD/TarI family cytidylyltransferase [Mycolicibacterium poriferae]|uniref:IspD/TarI family cytidylyltransferase n=1 Tax=Mycolicibacterium poriferae TaxID=39694 RepID=UPI0024BABAD5|nr:IspD/TarI family cytidylyltransferase [Mycolicibacterium poriferae]